MLESRLPELVIDNLKKKVLNYDRIRSTTSITGARINYRGFECLFIFSLYLLLLTDFFGFIFILYGYFTMVTHFTPILSYYLFFTLFIYLPSVVNLYPTEGKPTYTL